MTNSKDELKPCDMPDEIWVWEQTWSKYPKLAENHSNGQCVKYTRAAESVDVDALKDHNDMYLIFILL